MKLTQKHIDTLIEVGKTLIIDEDQKKYLQDCDFINRLSSEEWDNHSSKLTDNDIINLFKGIVLVEKNLRWMGGSVAGGIWVYSNIRKRHLDFDYQIANWALQTTENDYIPFGFTNHGVKSAVAYFLMQRDFSHRKEIEKISKENRLLEKKISGLNNTISGLEKDIQELKKKLEYAELSGNELANIIISDNDHPVYHYFHEIEKLINDKSVDTKLLETILGRFKQKERRNIKELKNRLIEAIANRQ